MRLVRKDSIRKYIVKFRSKCIFVVFFFLKFNRNARSNRIIISLNNTMQIIRKKVVRRVQKLKRLFGFLILCTPGFIFFFLLRRRIDEDNSKNNFSEVTRTRSIIKYAYISQLPDKVFFIVFTLYEHILLAPKSVFPRKTCKIIRKS